MKIFSAATTVISAVHGSKVLFVWEKEQIFKDDECHEVCEDCHKDKKHRIYGDLVDKHEMMELAKEEEHVEEGEHGNLGMVYPLAVWYEPEDDVEAAHVHEMQIISLDDGVDPSVICGHDEEQKCHEDVDLGTDAKGKKVSELFKCMSPLEFLEHLEEAYGKMNDQTEDGHKVAPKGVDHDAEATKESTASPLIFVHEMEMIYKDDKCTEVDPEAHTAKFHNILEKLQERKDDGVHPEHGKNMDKNNVVGTIYPLAIWEEDGMVHEMEVVALGEGVDAATACEKLSTTCHHDEFADNYVAETFTCLSRRAFAEKLIAVAEMMHEGVKIEAGKEGAEDEDEHAKSNGEHAKDLKSEAEEHVKDVGDHMKSEAKEHREKAEDAKEHAEVAAEHAKETKEHAKEIKGHSEEVANKVKEHASDAKEHMKDAKDHAKDAKDHMTDAKQHAEDTAKHAEKVKEHAENSAATHHGIAAASIMLMMFIKELAE